MNVRRKGAWAFRLALVSIITLAGILLLTSRSMRTHAQNQPPYHVRVPVVSDWSHRHLVYSRPTSTEQTLKLQSETRYRQQLTRQHDMVSQDPQ